MRSAAFKRGFDDARAGRHPNFDDCDEDAAWSYERGRLFSHIAPAAMPLRVDGKLNPNAIKLFDAASKRGYIP